MSNIFDDYNKNTIKVNIDNTILFIQNLCNSINGKIVSKYPTIDGLDIVFKKEYRHIKFSTNPILDCEDSVQYQDSTYGFQDSFKIESDYVLRVDNFVGEISIKLSDFTASGEFWEIETDTYKNTEGFFRAVLPLKDSAKPPHFYLSGQPMFLDKSFRASGYIDVKFGNNEIGFFDFNIGKQNYIIIESKNKVTYMAFDKIVESIIFSYAFISGNLIRDEIILLKFKDNDFCDIIDFKYKRIEDSVDSFFELINPREYKLYLENTKRELSNLVYFPVSIFCELVNLCNTNNPILRAVKIITQSRNLSNEIKTASFFVALETIKQQIIQNQTTSVTPIKEKEQANELIIKIQRVVNDIPDNLFNDKNIILRKIENLNTIGNNDSFELAFKIVQFNLTKDDKTFIKQRNRFLHGNIPFDNEEENVKNKKIEEIMFQTHFLVCSLLLKYINYSGIVKDLLCYTQLFKEKQLPEKPLFREI